MTETLAFNRRFQIWSYTVSHGTLLLRSTKAPGTPTRVDVLFKDVAAINLPTNVDGLTIERADDAAAREAASTLDEPELRGRTVFAVRGRGCRGHVVAGAVFHHEDEGEFFDPSALLE